MGTLKTTASLDVDVTRVWSVLADGARYRRWTRTFGFLGRPVEGARVWMHVRLLLPLAVPVTFERVAPNVELRWSGGISGLLVGTHYLRLEAGEDGAARLVHGERFAGVAAPLFLWLLRGRLLRLYETFNDDLAAACRAERP